MLVDYSVKVGVLASFVPLMISAFLILYFGYYKHYTNYKFPFFQFSSLIMLTCSFILQITFFMGVIFFRRYALFEIVTILVLAATASTFFFIIMKKNLTIEALKKCLKEQFSPLKYTISPDFDLETQPNSQEALPENPNNDDLLKLEAKINEKGTSQIGSRAFQNICVVYIFLTINTFRHAKLFRCCIGDRICKTEKAAEKFVSKTTRTVLLFSIGVPLLFIGLEVIGQLNLQIKAVSIILDVLKAIFTVNFMYSMSMIMGNISANLKYNMLNDQFKCLKLILMCFFIQHFVFGLIHFDNELGRSLNFVVLSIENCLIIILSLKYYGLNEKTFKKNKGKIQSNDFADEEQEKKVENLENLLDQDCDIEDL